MNAVDSVLSWHVNPATCGVAKWSQALAARLGVPFGSLTNAGRYHHPLLSLKGSELTADRILHLSESYDLFLHDVEVHWRVIVKATRVYAANPVIARSVRAVRPDVIEAWCPSTIQGNPSRGTINVLTFGMAGRLQLQHFRKLKQRLDAQPLDYTVSLSTAVHEGSPWDAVVLAGDELRAVFGDRLRCLGFLADDAIAKELKNCSVVALFFDPALRANNTTFWAAVDALKMVITNLDADSPDVRDCSVANIDATSWPFIWSTRAGIHDYAWDRLLILMGAHIPA